MDWTILNHHGGFWKLGIPKSPWNQYQHGHPWLGWFGYPPWLRTPQYIKGRRKPRTISQSSGFFQQPLLISDLGSHKYGTAGLLKHQSPSDINPCWSIPIRRVCQWKRKQTICEKDVCSELRESDTNWYDTGGPEIARKQKDCHYQHSIYRIWSYSSQNLSKWVPGDHRDLFQGLQLFDLHYMFVALGIQDNLLSFSSPKNNHY